MTNKTLIELDEKNNLFFEKQVEVKKTQKEHNVIFITLFIILLSLIFCFLQNMKWKPLQTLYKYKRIKKNMNSWSSIIQEKTGIEKNKGKILLATEPNSVKLKILDFGSYYAIGRLNPHTLLPEFIQRGNSGPWRIIKSDKEDLAAYQFAEFVLEEHINDVVTCGNDLFKKRGFSGYFIPNSPCELAINALQERDSS